MWRSLQGILRHLAVLKYMQSIQRHHLFGMSLVPIKNKKGTDLVFGVNPRGLFVFRKQHTDNAIVSFSWSECRELSFVEKKFTILVRNNNGLIPSQGRLTRTDGGQEHQAVFCVLQQDSHRPEHAAAMHLAA